MSLEQLSLWQRILLAAAIVLAVFFILLALTRVLGDAEAREPSADLQLYQGIPLNAALLRLDKEALDAAYKENLIHLFGVWLRGQAQSDKEITNGIRIARSAYNNAAQQIAKREQQLNQDSRP